MNDTLERIAHAAHHVEKWLSRNAGHGTHADWPLRLEVDNKPDAKRLAKLLTELTKSLKPFRKQHYDKRRD